MAKFIDSDGWLYIWGKLKTMFAGKVDKVTGKGLSTNDYTTAEKNKLAGIDTGANAYTHPGYTAQTGKPSANQTPAFGSTFTVSQVESDASGHVTGMTDRTVKIPNTAATTGAAGLMSAADKQKLDGIAAGANNYTYTLPTASADTKGGIKIGAGLTMTGEVLSADVQSVPVMVGATSGANGAAGLVPAPETGDRNCFLRGDGLWWETPDTDEKVKVTTMSSTGDTDYPLMAVYNASPSSGHTYGGAIPTTAALRPKVNGKTGLVTADAFSGKGSALTNLNASNLASGTVGAARLPAASASAQGAMSAAHYSKLEALPSAATLASTYALKSELPSGAFIYKGTVANLAALQAVSSPSVGDVYNVGSDTNGMNYAWNGTSWDSLGEVMEVDALTNAEIDAIMSA